MLKIISFLFRRGVGPLKTSMDVINAAKKISEAGTKLDKIAREVAAQCPVSHTKNDMIAYLDRIGLYCQQLNITSKVKADVHSISGSLIVSGVSKFRSIISLLFIGQFLVFVFLKMGFSIVLKTYFSVFKNNLYAI